MIATASHKTWLAGLLVLLLITTSTMSHAEQKKRFGNYEVHYSVFNSTFVSAEVARAYGIVRGDNRGILNIAIREQLKDGSDAPAKAKVSGSSTNLIHRRELEFKEVVEQGAIYYIAEFEYDNKDMRHFDIRVQPNPKVAPYRLKFSKSLYND